MLSLTLQELNDLIDARVEEALLNHRVSPWMSEAQAQAYTSFSHYTLFNARERGELKFVKQSRAIRYHRDDLDRWMRTKEGHKKGHKNKPSNKKKKQGGADANA